MDRSEHLDGMKERVESVAANPRGRVDPFFQQRVLNVLGSETETRWAVSQLDAYLTFLQMTLHLKNLLDDVVAAHGLTIGMAGVLGQLARIDDKGMRLSDLATAVGLSPSRITRLIIGLERRGLVVKTVGEHDSRVSNASLTSSGRSTATEMQLSIRHIVEKEFLAALGEKGVTAIARLLHDALARSQHRASLGNWENFEIGT
jgi:DNA-binding MarR family transcriptional regulator